MLDGETIYFFSKFEEITKVTPKGIKSLGDRPISNAEPENDGREYISTGFRHNKRLYYLVKTEENTWIDTLSVD